MKEYTLNISSTFGKIDKWIESDDLLSLQNEAYKAVSEFLPKLEPGETIQCSIMHSCDLINRAHYVPIIWSIDANKQDTKNHFFHV